jgi:steroid 5-alpha reductase family enzyme
MPPQIISIYQLFGLITAMVYTGLLFPNESIFYEILMLAMIIIAVGTFILLFFVSAPYGRHLRKGWGPTLSNFWGWVLMESPCLLVMFVFFFFSDKWFSVTHIVFLVIWALHYGHRVLLYPFQILNGKRMPLTISLMGFTFNLINTYIQARWLFTLSDPQYASSFIFSNNVDYSSISWLYDPRFLIGVFIFLLGYFINKQSDIILQGLKKQEGPKYKIPYGGLFKYISCPNYFGEILEWIGWAVLTWSIAGAIFVVWTMANLLPRAISHHNWYKENFEEYPEKRKAMIPFLI